MSWRTALIAQARSDNEVMKTLNQQRFSYCHQLHYLQMTTEKLAKGFLASDSSDQAPAFTHVALVPFLRVIKGKRAIRQYLKFNSSDVFSAFIDSLIPLADQVQRLAPNFAGATLPNPEYPWRSTPAHDIVAPVDFDFPEFRSNRSKMIQLADLIDKLLKLPA